MCITWRHSGLRSRVQQLTLNQNTFSFSFLLKHCRQRMPQSSVLCWTCCQLLIEIRWLIPCISSQIWSSSPIWWFNIFLEICLSNSCYLYPMTFRWTSADLLLLSAVEPMLCFSKHPHLYKGCGVNVLCIKQTSLWFSQLLSAGKCMNSECCPYVTWEGVTLAAGRFPCQNPVGNMNRERKNRGALLFTVIRPCVLPAAYLFLFSKLIWRVL